MLMENKFFSEKSNNLIAYNVIGILQYYYSCQDVSYGMPIQTNQIQTFTYLTKKCAALFVD